MVAKRFTAIPGRSKTYRQYQNPKAGGISPKATKGTKSVVNLSALLKVRARLMIRDYAKRMRWYPEEYEEMLLMLQLDNDSFVFSGLGELVPKFEDRTEH